MEYVIVGDTDRYEGCLIFVCGKSKRNAKKVLDKILRNPDNNERRAMEGHRNIRIEEVDDQNCWWNERLD